MSKRIRVECIEEVIINGKTACAKGNTYLAKPSHDNSELAITNDVGEHHVIADHKRGYRHDDWFKAHFKEVSK